MTLPKAIFEGAPIGLGVVESSGVLEWANRAFLDLVGLDRGSVGADLAATFSSSQRPLLEAIQGARTHRNPVTLRSIPTGGGRPAGERFVDLAIHPVSTYGPDPPAVLVVVTDATERVRERERAALFYAAFLTSTNAIEVTDRAGILTDVNPAFERIYGYSREECIGRKPNLVRGRNTPRELYESMWADLLDPKRGHWAGELQNRDRMGKERPVFLSISAIRGEDGATTHYLGVAVDLTEQRSWERRAAHSDKLASLGQLAAGVAHEINTPLANVLLVAENLRRRSPDPWVYTRADTIKTQAEVAGAIVRGLLDFARRSEPKILPFDLPEACRAAVTFLRGKQSENVEIVEDYPPEPVLVLGDRDQIIQVVTVLLNNAYDAMEGRGRVSIRVRRNTSSGEFEVTDSGPGISVEALPHIFEPFFTTKPEGKGTGLGLAISHGIVQAHHGQIRARNGSDAGGASFVVNLPIAPPHSDSGADEPRTSSPRPAREQTGPIEGNP
ncbi:MAG TPA: PAS domain S-box protein [Thermoplasmata archaeon]|nr:PAS domain S-box protein [Thermoplasmata archaeon]